MSVMETVRSVLNPSGGLVYHISALRHRNVKWKKYRENIENWLMSWPVREGDLLLIGPSAGYSLSSTFLSQYRKVDAIDLDPIARKLFYRQHRKYMNDLQWHQKDAFNPINGLWNPEGLQVTLSQFPNHTILFCNILGQLPLLYPQLIRSVEWNLWQKNFQKAISGRRWASYHDLYSMPVNFNPMDQNVLDRWERDQANSGSDYLEKIVSSSVRKKSISVADHCTRDLFPAGRRRLFPWQRTSNSLHIVEARRN